MDFFREHFIKHHTLVARSAVLDITFKPNLSQPTAGEIYLVAFILDETNPAHYHAFVMIGSSLEKYAIDPKLDLGFLEQVLHGGISEQSVQTINRPNVIWLKGDGRDMVALSDTEYYWINTSTIHTI